MRFTNDQLFTLVQATGSLPLIEQLDRFAAIWGEETALQMIKSLREAHAILRDHLHREEAEGHVSKFSSPGA